MDLVALLMYAVGHVVPTMGVVDSTMGSGAAAPVSGPRGRLRGPLGAASEILCPPRPVQCAYAMEYTTLIPHQAPCFTGPPVHAKCTCGQVDLQVMMPQCMS